MSNSITQVNREADSFSRLKIVTNKSHAHCFY